MDPSIPVKPGYKTTEFWLVALGTTLSFLVSNHILDSAVLDSTLTQGIALANLILGPVGYTISRSVVKAKAS